MIYGHSECLHAALAGVSDYHEKNFVPNSGPSFRERLILECDLYSNKYGKYNIILKSESLKLFNTTYLEFLARFSKEPQPEGLQELFWPHVNPLLALGMTGSPLGLIYQYQSQM